MLCFFISAFTRRNRNDFTIHDWAKGRARFREPHGWRLMPLHLRVAALFSDCIIGTHFSARGLVPSGEEDQ